MNTMGKTIAKNAGVMLASQLITWLLALVLTLFLPRYLGPEGVGKYQLASSIWAVMSIVLSFGMDVLQTKEIARNKERSNELLTTTISLRLGLYLVCFIAVSIFVHIAGYPAETIKVINIISVSTLIYQISGAFAANLQAYEKMEFISLSDILSKAFLTLVSITALLLGYDVYVIAWINASAGLISIAVQLYGLSKIHQLKPVYKSELFGWILKSSVPYMLVSGFLVAYNQIDVIIISLLVNETEIGWYSAASRLYGTFLFFPSVLIAAVFPVFSRLHQTDPATLKKIMVRSFDLLLLMGIPIGLGLFTIAHPLVILLFGEEFAPGGPILSIMGLVIISTYLNALLGKFFISIDRQNVWTWVMGIAALSTIPLDLILVPLCQTWFGNGALGGAFSYLITEGGMMIAGIALMPKGMLDRKNAVFALKATLAGLCMGLCSWLLRDYFIAIPILVGAAVYVGAIFLFRVLSAEEIALLKEIWGKIISRVKNAKPQPVEIHES